MQDISVPQSWFAHFYAVGAAFNLAILAAMSSMVASATKPSLLLLPLLGSLLLQLHLTRRLLESVLVMRYPAGARMHAIAYLFGLRYAVFFLCEQTGRVWGFQHKVVCPVQGCSYYIVLPLSMLPDGAWQQLPAHLLHEPRWSSIWQSLSAPCSKIATPAIWLVSLVGMLLRPWILPWQEMENMLCRAWSSSWLATCYSCSRIGSWEGCNMRAASQGTLPWAPIGFLGAAPSSWSPAHTTWRRSSSTQGWSCCWGAQMASSGSSSLGW